MNDSNNKNSFKIEIETLISKKGYLIKDFCKKANISTPSYYNYVYNGKMSVRLRAKIDQVIEDLKNEKI